MTKKLGFIRCDVDESIGLMLDIDAIQQLPTGVCACPISIGEDKDKIVICKEGEKIKIFKMQEVYP